MNEAARVLSFDEVRVISALGEPCIVWMDYAFEDDPRVARPVMIYKEYVCGPDVMTYIDEAMELGYNRTMRCWDKQPTMQQLEETDWD